jgi:hypothetical protein
VRAAITRPLKAGGCGYRPSDGQKGFQRSPAYPGPGSVVAPVSGGRRADACADTTGPIEGEADYTGVLRLGFVPAHGPVRESRRLGSGVVSPGQRHRGRKGLRLEIRRHHSRNCLWDPI